MIHVAEKRATALATKVGSVFSVEVEEQAKIEMAAALKANRTVRERDADGRIQWIVVPDTALRFAVATKILEFNVGKPINRTLIADVSPSFNQAGAATAEDLFKLLCEAPDVAAGILEKLKTAALKAQKPKTSEINVTPLLAEPERKSA